MREILFRGKSKHNGEWAEGNLFAQDDVVTILPTPTNIGTGFGGLWWIDDGFDPVDPETVGQFTGLTDKNGVKVFEGDIIRVNTDGKNMLGWVSFERSGFHFRFFKTGSALLTEWVQPLEVIGNIHDNPELLEVSK